MLVKWPGVIKPNTIINEIMAHEDWLPTLLAAAGDTSVKNDLLAGTKVGDKTFKTHLDGYNFLPYFNGEVTGGPRHEFFYFSNTADLMAMRYDEWKISFKTIKGNLFTGEPSSTQAPIVTNLRMDPWERYQDESMNYGKWWGEKLWTMVPATVIVAQFLQTFVAFPPSQKSGGLTVSQFLEAVQNGATGAGK
jgi:arylsulfatase A-like enzyme